jgi:hypothetical protein
MKKYHRTPTIELSQNKGMHIHFRLPHVGMLPGGVHMLVPKELEPKPPKVGEIVFQDKAVCVSSLFKNLQSCAWPSVACNTTWLQMPDPSGHKDKYSVYFCFVPRDLRNGFLAQHDVSVAQKVFDKLSIPNWDVILFANEQGQLDLTCSHPDYYFGGVTLELTDHCLGLKAADLDAA